LIVEDDPADVHLLLEAFRRSGVPAVNIQVAKDGDEAISTLASFIPARIRDSVSGLPSFVVLDLRLRRRTGLSVLEWIKSVPALADLPVLVLSGIERPEEIARAIALGAASTYSKPFHFGELLGIVECILSRWQICREPGARRIDVSDTQTAESLAVSSSPL